MVCRGPECWFSHDVAQLCKPFRDGPSITMDHSFCYLMLVPIQVPQGVTDDTHMFLYIILGHGIWKAIFFGLKHITYFVVKPIFIISSPEPLGSQGELIVYPWSGVRRPSVVRPSSSSSTMLKHLLLRNRLADQSQILCGASLGRGNESLYKWSGSHDQDGRHAHIW